MKINIILLLAVLFVFAACENQDWEFPDYTEQAAYFPNAAPVRTVNLGDSRYDNSIDKEKAFSIGVGMGGVYENNSERIISFKYAPELINNHYAVVAGSDTLLVLPESYYTLSESENFVIPEGEFNGTIRVNLNDNFFNDPISITGRYVLPLIIESDSSKSDDAGYISVLSGTAKEGVEDPDRLIADNWDVQPKDYTLFGVKYVNEFNGRYLHRGVKHELDGKNGNVVNTTVYSERFIEQDQITTLKTKSLTESHVNRVANSQGAEYFMKLKFNSDKSINISQIDTITVMVDGSGSYLNAGDEGADVWGQQSRRTIFLDYNYEFGGTYFHCVDTLVYRDENISFDARSVAVVAAPVIE